MTTSYNRCASSTLTSSRCRSRATRTRCVRDVVRRRSARRARSRARRRRRPACTARRAHPWAPGDRHAPHARAASAVQRTRPSAPAARVVDETVRRLHPTSTARRAGARADHAGADGRDPARHRPGTLRPARRRRALAARARDPAGVRIVGTVGLLKQQKRHDLLVEAAAEVDAAFVIAGEAPSGRRSSGRSRGSDWATVSSARASRRNRGARRRHGRLRARPTTT